MSLKKLVERKNYKVKFGNIPKTDVEYNSVTYGCSRSIDSYRLLSMSLDELVKNLNEDDFNLLKKNFLTNCNIQLKKSIFI